MAQAPVDVAPKSQSPDDRFKVDLLLVVAHPDDESAVGPYLARAIFDEGRRVEVVFTTSGEGGRNAVGVERGASMAAVRQIEARRALARRTTNSRLVGNSAALTKIQSRIEMIAPSDAATLISGESGTGKELVARMIH